MGIVHVQLRESERTGEKRCRDRCQVNDLEHILSEKKKKNLLMIECLKCVTASLNIRSVHIHMYVHKWLLCIRLKRTAVLSISSSSSSFFCYIITLLKINFIIEVSIVKIMSYIHLVCLSPLFLSCGVCILSNKRRD